MLIDVFYMLCFVILLYLNLQLMNIIALLTMVHLVLGLPHLCYNVSIFMVSITHLGDVSTKLNLDYIYKRLAWFRHGLVKAINNPERDLVTAHTRYMKTNQENGRFLLTLLIIFNIPTNIFLVNYVFLVRMNAVTQIITINLIMTQLIGILIISLSIASTSKAFHARGRLFVPIQGRVRSVRNKLVVLRLFEMVHTNKIVSISLGPVEKVNYMRVFELSTFYMAQFILIQQFFREQFL